MEDQSPGTLTDWNRLREQTDDDIAAAVRADPDVAPIPSPEELLQFKPTPARRPG